MVRKPADVMARRKKRSPLRGVKGIEHKRNLSLADKTIGVP